MNKILYVLLTILPLLTGCSLKSSADRELAAVETILAESGDSAVSILARMDTTALSEMQKNRRTLLYAYTCAIHGAPLRLDSADIRQGDAAFQGRFNTDEIKWLQIKADDAKLKGNPVARIEYLKDAEFIALQLDAGFDLAMIYLSLANVYQQGFNGTVSKYYADKAVGILRTLDCPKQLREAKMAVAGALGATHDYKAMLDSLSAMREEVMTNAPESYKIFFIDQLARVSDENGRSEEAIALWHSIYDGKEISSNTLAHWAAAYCRINRPDSAYMLIQRANATPHNITDEYLCRNIEYRILEKMGRPEAELKSIDSLRKVANNNVFADRKLEESSLALNLKYDSATRKAWIDTARARTRTYLAICVAIIIAIMAAATYSYLHKRNRLLQLEHENDILKIHTLQTNLFESTDRHKGISAKISGLFQSRFRLLDGLAASYFECKDTGQEQKRIYSEVKNSINSFSSPTAIRELEEVVDTFNDNLMKTFRADFPKLSQAQYRLALFLFCGFSLQSISIFTESDIRNIYVYKSRLKGIISRSDTPRKEHYLLFFR